MAETDHKLNVGDRAPDFALPASTGAKIALKDLRGRTVVLYFYPKADTPGCTKQACGFRDAMREFNERGSVVLGVSPDTVDEVNAFAEKFKLPFPLLADADRAVIERYGVWGERTLYGRKFMGVIRTTFVIAPDGTVAHVFRNVRPEGHERKVLERIQDARASEKIVKNR